MNNLASKHYTNIHHKVIGYDIGKRTVYRTGSWHMPEEQFPFSKYPSYITGGFTCLRSDILTTLIKTSEFVPITRLEDVYLTGIVRKIAGYNVTHDKDWGAGIAQTEDNYQRMIAGKIIAAHHGWINRRIELYEQMKLHENHGT